MGKEIIIPLWCSAEKFVAKKWPTQCLAFDENDATCGWNLEFWTRKWKGASFIYVYEMVELFVYKMASHLSINYHFWSQQF